MATETKIPDIDFILRRVFNKKSFRPPQRDIIIAALQGHDIFVQAATSFGKSLCYQLPAVVDHGITVCISPLLSLMRDQVSQLQSSGVKVATLNGTTSKVERDEIVEDLCCGHPRIRLLYVTPEFCLTESFRGHLRTIYGHGELARVAIDEAHCVSEWGHDFRGSYLQLSFFRSSFPKTPIICLTGTATRSVQEDVIATLGLDCDNLRVFNTTTSRPNLHFEVRFITEDNDVRFKLFLSWIRSVYTRQTESCQSPSLKNESVHQKSITGIIYTSTRDCCDDLASRLRAEGIGAAAYHAGLKPQDRLDCQNKWLRNNKGYNIIVATTAFGMGIDKEDVRFVLHWNLPKSFESFYQEAGRAGRDGNASLCTIFYSREDCSRTEYRVRDNVQKTFLTNGPRKASIATFEARLESFRRLIDYCESTDRCRHQMIGQYFGESQGSARCDLACDFCKNAKDLSKRKESRLVCGPETEAAHFR